MSKKSEAPMLSEYFNRFEDYKKRFGDKTLLLWQCGNFYEVYMYMHIYVSKFD